MFMHFLKSLNWVDLLMLAILIRIVYIGIKAGVITEMFKLLGALLTTFVCFHYYIPLSNLLARLTKAPWMNVLEFVSFVLLWIVMFLICKLIRDGMFMLFTIEASSMVDKWGGAVVGISRFFIIGSMTLFLFLVSSGKYFETKATGSFSGRHILTVAPNFYIATCDGIVSRVFPSERVNKAVREQLKKVEAR